MDRDSAMGFVQRLLQKMLDAGSSDLFITTDAAPSVKINGELQPLVSNVMSEMNTRMLVRAIMNDHQLRQFEENMECNFAISLPGSARFRVNAFTQRGCSGMVFPSSTLIAQKRGKNHLSCFLNQQFSNLLFKLSVVTRNYL